MFVLFRFFHSFVISVKLPFSFFLSLIELNDDWFGFALLSKVDCDLFLQRNGVCRGLLIKKTGDIVNSFIHNNMKNGMFTFVR